jgi:hypothetical protein
MIDWAKISRENPVEWLLEKVNPSIRYFTLRDIFGKSENDPQLIAAKRAISESKILTRILHKQKLQGYWEEPDNPYHPKYKSSYWQIMALGQLGADKTNERVKRACEYIFQFQHQEGGFSSYTKERASEEYALLMKKGKKLPSHEEWVSSKVFEHQYSCLTGNIVAALARMGYSNDSRVSRALKWLVKIQNEDGGWLCPYWKAHIRDKHGCFYGTICPLEAFSEVKKECWNKEIKKTVEKGAEFLLMHHLFKADHHDYKVISKYWLKFSFPWFYGYNILRGLDVLTKLGYVNDERLKDAVEILLKKRQTDGTWILDNAPIGRMQANIEVKGMPSKWITLIALRILKRLSSADKTS